MLALFATMACSAENAPPGTGPNGGQSGTGGGAAGSSAGQAGGGSPSVGGGGAGGVATGGAGSGNAGTAGSSAGAAGSAGAGGSAGSGGAEVEPGYGPPPREIMIQGNSPVSISFTPADAAPGATSFHGGDQQARFNPGAPSIQKKLVIGLGGVGTGPHNGGGLGWAADRGYHTIGLDYFNESGGDQGLNYRESWSGEDVGDGNVGEINSIMNRVKTGLAFLQAQDPGSDWAYYLDADGNVRWNDVIVFGYSFGGQTGAAGTKYVALHRVVATSAPGISEEAAWVSEMPNVTPGTRSFTISGTDDGGHANHMATATRLGWPGAEINTSQSAPPYDDSHLLAVDFGHSEFCSLPTDVLANADEVCEFAFGYQAP
ncbi:MAG TPA: hypothetical protein VM686_25110 [Polyangiaceae bacterium]|nr:hypothetical protein [Polyangiaceae bacterium]